MSEWITARTVRVFQVDAFTDTRFAGNPASVVLDAERLGEAEVRGLAGEIGHGDCAFVYPSEGADHDLRLRFFTPRGESAFIGHATLAAHAALLAHAPPGTRRVLRQQQRSGIVEITAESTTTGARAAIRMAPPPLGAPLAPAALAAVLAALGLDTTDLDPVCPARIAGSGSTRALIGIADGARLATLRPDLGELARLSAAGGVPGYFVFSRRPALAGCDTEARMFCPAIGIDEDPVSGNAHAMLGAYLLEQGLLPVRGARAGFSGTQGHHLGRPGRVEVGLELESGRLVAAEIAGEAVIVVEGTAKLPA